MANAGLHNHDNEIKKALDKRVMPVQAASVAADATALKNDFNALLQKLKDAGLMKSQ